MPRVVSSAAWGSRCPQQTLPGQGCCHVVLGALVALGLAISRQAQAPACPSVGTRDLFHPQHRPLSPAGCSPQPRPRSLLLLQPRKRLGEATNHLFCRKTGGTNPTCLGGGLGGVWYYKGFSSILSL